MSEDLKILEDLSKSDYKWGFVSNIESDNAPKGLNEGIVRFISDKKNEPEWLLQWRLKAFRHWQTLQEHEPTWANIHHPRINYQDIIYYSAPKAKPQLTSLDELDPEAVFRRADILGVIETKFGIREPPRTVEPPVRLLDAESRSGELQIVTADIPVDCVQRKCDAGSQGGGVDEQGKNEDSEHGLKGVGLH